MPAPKLPGRCQVPPVPGVQVERPGRASVACRSPSKKHRPANNADNPGRQRVCQVAAQSGCEKRQPPGLRVWQPRVARGPAQNPLRARSSTTADSGPGIIDPERPTKKAVMKTTGSSICALSCIDNCQSFRARQAISCSRMGKWKIFLICIWGRPL